MDDPRDAKDETAKVLPSKYKAKEQAKQAEKEAKTEAYKQQETLFSQAYGMDEQEIAIRSMQISKSQDLYFSFLNNYWRMMSRIAEMGQ